jgi:hypothetical protein
MNRTVNWNTNQIQERNIGQYQCNHLINDWSSRIFVSDNSYTYYLYIADGVYGVEYLHRFFGDEFTISDLQAYKDMLVWR